VSTRVVQPVAPRTFYLNERQELVSFDRDGGGRAARYVAIDWAARSTHLATTFKAAVATAPRSVDPATRQHRYVVAVPVANVEKHSDSKRAVGGRIVEKPRFGGEQSTLFRKMGVDLVETHPSEGKVTLHIPASRVAPLLATMSALQEAGTREQSRWIHLAGFEQIPPSARIDLDWLQSLGAASPTFAFIRFHPMLLREEFNEVLEVLAPLVSSKTTRLTRSGREFSGRYWCAGLFVRPQLQAVAEGFPTVQSIHPPLPTYFSGAPKGRGPSSTAGAPLAGPRSPSDLPTVAVVDCGIPENHSVLAPYRRFGFRDPDQADSPGYLGDHGSRVASAVVFGDVEVSSSAPAPLIPKCRAMDVNVASTAVQVNDEILIPAIESVVGTAPDVRVFNLSFDTGPLASASAVRQREYRSSLQNLDNLAFARDIVLVLAAGNSPSGVVPQPPYPRHLSDERWALGAYAQSFNGLVCGSFVKDTGVDDSVVSIIGAPSPYTRIGPGMCDSPVPGFSAQGGNCRSNYEYAYSSGVGGYSSVGLWEDSSGTSLSAPLVAREAAMTVQHLLARCAPGTLPLAGTVKAWMSLVARRAPLRGAFEKLARVTLGRGFPSAARLATPDPSSSVFIWQTVLVAPSHVNRVQLPLPLEWLEAAAQPMLRVIAAWNTPVNAALTHSWACRKVATKVRPFGAAEALTGGGAAKGGYPLLDREFQVGIAELERKGFVPSSQDWIIECEYEEIGAYPPAMTFSAQQKVGIVIELRDAGEHGVGPQAYVQASPSAVFLDRLSVLHQPLEAPVSIKR
jgi:hypothetical protein